MNEISTTVLGDFSPAMLPGMVVVGAAAVIFLGGTMRANRNLWGGVSLAGLAIAGWACYLQGSSTPPADQTPEVVQGAKTAIYAAPLVFDHLASLIRIIALGSGVVLALMSWHEVPDSQAADHQACLLIVVAGFSLVGAGNDLVTLFLALELISIPSYILLYLPRHDEASQEAAMKYFLLSIFSSALLLFGFSYLYCLAGTTNL